MEIENAIMKHVKGIEWDSSHIRKQRKGEKYEREKK